MAVNTYSINRADAVTAVSAFMQHEAYERLTIRHQIRVIPNFVDPDLYSPSPGEEVERGAEGILVTHVSNFRPVKRIQDLVYAMRIVVKEAPGARLVLVGDGPDRHGIEKLIEHLNLGGSVTLTGFRNDVANILRCSDIGVLCSETESAPLTLLEGMSCGLPMVATSVGGIPEVVRDGFNGLLVPPKQPEELAEAILKLASDGELRGRLGAAARETVLERFTADKAAKAYIETFEGVTGA